MNKRTTAFLALAAFAATVPTAAQAYVGPGAGLSLVAAFWAVLVALGAVVLFTLTWPLRRWLKRRGNGRLPRTGGGEHRPPRSDGMAHGGRHGS